MTQRGTTGAAWTDMEIDTVLGAYFDMYERSSHGEKFKKAQVYRAVSEKLEVRSPASVALKMSNISFVMVELGWPHLPGVGGMSNIQKAIVPRVMAAIADRQSLDVVASRIIVPALQHEPMALTLDEGTPKIGRLSLDNFDGRAIAVKRDYVEMEANNSRLGLSGELAVLEFEERRLHAAGATKLARRIEHVSQTRGDGLGYDVMSFEANGREKYIEVKTTTGGNSMPFFLTRREIQVSTAVPGNYCLARVYDYPKVINSERRPRLYELRGALDESCLLRPETFRAVPTARVNR